jgi:hypothetical protein
MQELEDETLSALRRPDRIDHISTSASSSVIFPTPVYPEPVVLSDSEADTHPVLLPGSTANTRAVHFRELVARMVPWQRVYTTPQFRLSGISDFPLPLHARKPDTQHLLLTLTLDLCLFCALLQRSKLLAAVTQAAKDTSPPEAATSNACDFENVSSMRGWDGTDESHFVPLLYVLNLTLASTQYVTPGGWDNPSCGFSDWCYALLRYLLLTRLASGVRTVSVAGPLPLTEVLTVAASDPLTVAGEAAHTRLMLASTIEGSKAIITTSGHTRFHDPNFSVSAAAVGSHTSLFSCQASMLTLADCEVGPAEGDGAVGMSWVVVSGGSVALEGLVAKGTSLAVGNGCVVRGAVDADESVKIVGGSLSGVCEGGNGGGVYVKVEEGGSVVIGDIVRSEKGERFGKGRIGRPFHDILQTECLSHFFYNANLQSTFLTSLTFTHFLV